MNFIKIIFEEMVFVFDIKDYERKINKEWKGFLFDMYSCRFIILRCKGVYLKFDGKGNILLMDVVL